MDQNYPLRSYAIYDDYHTGHDNSSSQIPAQRGNYQFSVPRKAIKQDQFNTNVNYEPLNQPTAGSSKPTTSGHAKPETDSWLRWWWVEVLAAFISTASLVAIVAVLLVYNGRGLDHLNLPVSLTLNGIVAALATVSRVALMIPVGSALSQETWLWFSDPRQRQKCRSRLKDLDLSDGASRGAWGSLVFLFSARARWLAYLGVFVTILSLAFGTAVQQLITIGNLDVTDVGSSLLPGSIPRAEFWQYNSRNPAENRGYKAPLDLRAAIFNGMLSNDIKPIAATCHTGNCTWPVTPSLAICAECSASTYDVQCNNTICTYTMPSGSQIPLVNSKLQSYGVGFVVNNVTNGSTYDRNRGDRLYIAITEIIGAPYQSTIKGFTNDSFKASECAMWMCIQAYKVTSDAGNQTQTTVEEFTTFSPLPTQHTVFDNFTFAPLPSSMNPVPKTDYNVSLVGAATFASSLAKMFGGNAWLDLSVSPVSSDTVEAIWRATSQDLNVWIKRVALSMTNALRSYVDAGKPTPVHAQYAGTAQHLGIRVQWLWIILPATVVLLSHVFLALVMIRTAGSEVAPWKSSLLTALFFDVDPELKARAAGLAGVNGGLDEAVGEARVVLRNEGSGWVFRAVR